MIEERETYRLEHEAEGCPACGEYTSYCQGHGEIGDPEGYARLQLHDMGSHGSCHPIGCEDAL
jgi:hypothetical protein